MIVFTVTALDIISDPVLGVRRTPAIFTSLNDAICSVKNNDNDISDEGTYQFAVIEETLLNCIRPVLSDGIKLWFKYNSIADEFEECDVAQVPFRIARLSGFGIG